MNRSALCVVFDLDDTLYLEKDYVKSGFHAVGDWCKENLGLDDVQKSAQSLFDQGQRGNIFDAVLKQGHAKQVRETAAVLVQVYREHAPKIAMPQDAVTCLAQLRGQVRLGLLTDGHPVSQRAKISSLGLQEVFDEIVITGDWGTEFYKPNPRAFRQFETDRSSLRFVYVADNPAKDFLAPRQLGWDAIRVNRPASLHHDRRCPPENVVCEVNDLSSVADLCLSFSNSSLKTKDI
jgi:putative hydrolase of the HAD superfamily